MKQSEYFNTFLLHIPLEYFLLLSYMLAPDEHALSRLTEYDSWLSIHIQSILMGSMHHIYIQIKCITRKSVLHVNASCEDRTL